MVDFLRLSGRSEVTRDEFRSYVSQSAPRATDTWEATRIFDIYLTAALWRVFGIRWGAYFVFYALVSTAASLLLFGIARRVTDSYWCGVAASVGFLASPAERCSAIIAGADVGSVRRLDLSGWHLGLPLSFVFDERGISAESTFVGGHEPATDGLPDPPTVAEFLRNPRGFLVAYQPSRRHFLGD